MIKITDFLLKFNIDLRKKIYKEIHETFGGKMRMFISGAAALDPEVIKSLRQLGFTVVQGYGMTECSPIAAVNRDAAYAAKSIIDGIVFEPEVGQIYTGRVTRIIPIGAFVEIAPGKEGLVHISKLDKSRVEKVEDVVSIGDEIVVKVTEIDRQGRINLSRKDALADIEAKRNNG